MTQRRWLRIPKRLRVPLDPRYDDHLTPLVKEGQMVWAVYGYDHPTIRQVPILEVEAIMVRRGSTDTTRGSSDIEADDDGLQSPETDLVLARYGYWIPDGGGGISEPGWEWFLHRREAVQEAWSRRLDHWQYLIDDTLSRAWSRLTALGRHAR